MKSTAKAEALVRELKDKFSKRFPTKTIRQAADAAGFPMLFLSASGSEAAGQSVIAVRIKGEDAVSKDVFGNALASFAPHLMQIAWELTASDNPIPSDADIFVVTAECSKVGVRMQLKEIANASAVTEANIDAAAVAADLDDLYWPTKGV